MATVTIYPTADGFLNNISGWYPSEGFNLSRNTSSSSADYCLAFTKFTTVGAGIGAGDTIDSVTFWWDVYNWSDVNNVAFWSFYTDITPVWGAWDESTPPSIPSGIGYGTVAEGGTGLGSTGWNSKSLTTSIPKSNVFGVGISADLGDLGPALMYFYDKDSGANAPYIVIDYTPAASPAKGSTLATMGVG